MPCEDCLKDQKKIVAIGVAGGLAVGAAIAFVALRFLGARD